MKNKIQKIIDKSQNPKLIEGAFSFAKEAYKNKFRVSGENYIEHAVRVATFLDKMNLDATTIAFGLLHDALDDMPESAKILGLQEIEKKFGKEISELVKKNSNLARIRFSLAINLKEKKNVYQGKNRKLKKNVFSAGRRFESSFGRACFKIRRIKLSEFFTRRSAKIIFRRDFTNFCANCQQAWAF